MCANLARIIIAFTFIFSGFVKAVDPMGMFYKLNAYFANWDMMFATDSVLLRTGVVALATVEFILGAYWLLGARLRFTTVVTTFIMVLMTSFTVYIYVANPVSDCGCFGEAVKLSNGETLAKNIVLLTLSIFAIFQRRRMKRLISERNQWTTSMYALIYIICLSLYSLYYHPTIDFTDYKEGTNWRAAYHGEVSENAPEALSTLYFYNEKSDEDQIEEILSDGITYLLVLPDVATSDPGNADRFNDLYDMAQDQKFRFLCVVDDGASEEEIEQWVDQTGATYPIVKSDEVALKAMARSNPSLLLLEDGILLKKWSNNNLPEISEENVLDASVYEVQEQRKSLWNLLLLFLVPLLGVIFLDRIWVGSKYYKRYIQQKRLKKQKDMRKKIVAGNWKMNLNLQEGVALAKELNGLLVADKPACDVVICTPFIHLASVAGELDANVIGLGAENCADKVSGAYTGEVSAEMVKSTGAQYVILGHSERRAYYGETAEILREKTNLALANDLKVIFCIGEVLEERENGTQNEVVKAQLEGSLFDLTAEQFANVILAYEPVWAIGTGKTATAEQAQEMHAFIRGVIAEKFGAEAAENVSILYGGSCKPSNAKEIFAKPDVDGGLIGGAALKAEDFKGIIDAWK